MRVNSGGRPSCRSREAVYHRRRRNTKRLRVASPRQRRRRSRSLRCGNTHIRRRCSRWWPPEMATATRRRMEGMLHAETNKLTEGRRRALRTIQPPRGFVACHTVGLIFSASALGRSQRDRPHRGIVRKLHTTSIGPKFEELPNTRELSNELSSKAASSSRSHQARNFGAISGCCPG